MLRDLVTHINKNTDHKASIEAGGLKLDNRLYTPDQLNDLPPNCHPEIVQIIKTDKGGLAFAGQWAYLWNMYPVNFIYENVLYTSVEQCYQFIRAQAHGDTITAKKMFLSTDPFACKKLNSSISNNKEWLDSQLDTLYKSCECKFSQNSHLEAKLIETGDCKLLEATKDPFWGINAGLKAKATLDQTASGENHFGEILQKLRSHLISKLQPSKSESC